LRSAKWAKKGLSWNWACYKGLLLRLQLMLAVTGNDDDDGNAQAGELML